MTYDKPFKTYKEQIELLRSKNIQINDERNAERLLSTFSYYTLINGYKTAFLENSDSEQFIHGVTLENLVRLHVINSDINTIIFKYIIHVEKMFKTKLSYIIGRDYGITTNRILNRSDTNDYLNPYHYRGGHVTNTLASIQDALYQCRPNTSTYHYLTTKNHVPPWILVNDISFGKSIRWYTILQPNAKKELCDQFLPFSDLNEMDKKEFFRNGIEFLKNYRNCIAHGNKVLSNTLTSTIPKRQSLVIFKVLTDEREIDEIKRTNNNIFEVLLYLLAFLTDSLLSFKFNHELSSIFYRNKDFKCGNKTLYEIFQIPKDLLNH